MSTCTCISSNYAEFQSLLKREVKYDPLSKSDAMIYAEMSTQHPGLPPNRLLITAQLEATSLSNSQYSSIASLMCSMLNLPSGALVYAGHTLDPLTVHWHCSKAEGNPTYSIGLLTEMAEEGIEMITVGNKLEKIPQKIVRFEIHIHKNVFLVV